MHASDAQASLEAQIDQWRSYLRRRQAIHTVDVAELEDHLREQVAGLTDAGLSTDEAFLVAVKRLGDLDTLSREFAREHSDRLWKQLVAVQGSAPEADAQARREGWMAFALAVTAAAVTKLTMLLGPDINAPGSDWFYARNAPFFVLPLLAGFFAWKRELPRPMLGALFACFLSAGLFINLFPLVRESDVAALAALHLPMLLWLVVGVAYAGRRWRQVDGRMDFIRFTGEMFIYYVLIALGGGVLMGITAMLFEAIGIDFEPFMETWVLPVGVTGAVLIAAWLVEAKQSVIENMAPVLTRLFTPLFAIALIAFLGVLVFTGRGLNIERDLLIGFDLLLALVVALLLYSISARDPQQPPGVFDAVQLVLVLAALLVDIVALSAIASRITEYGFTPNRVAALGENVILLVNLSWSAVLSLRFLRGRGQIQALERWQTGYVPVYAVWALVVVVGFPMLFR